MGSSTHHFFKVLPTARLAPPIFFVRLEGEDVVRPFCDGIFHNNNLKLTNEENIPYLFLKSKELLFYWGLKPENSRISLRRESQLLSTLITGLAVNSSWSCCNNSMKGNGIQSFPAY